MTPETRVEIERTFQALATELHPVKRNSHGMLALARLIPLMDTLEKDEIRSFVLPLMEVLLKKQMENGCFFCFAKLCVFGELFCARRDPASAAFYTKMLDGNIKLRGITDKRDYRAEVYEVIEHLQRPGSADTPTNTE